MYPMFTARLMHDEALPEASSHPPEPAAGVSATASSQPELQRAQQERFGPALAPAQRERLVQQLRDPLYQFPLDDSMRLVSLVGEALPVLRAKRGWPTTVWCAPGQAIQRLEGSPGPYLLVTAVRTASGCCVQTALTDEIRPDQVAIPAHGASHRFPCPPHNLFDAMVRTVERRAPQPESVMGLRRILADWLEADAPQQPSASAGARGRHAGLAGFVEARGLSAGASAGAGAGAGAPPAPLRASDLNGFIPEALKSRTLALADALRHGQWPEVMATMAPQLLARLPQSHPFRLGEITIHLGEKKILRLNQEADAPAWQMVCAPDMRAVFAPECRRSAVLKTFFGPDGYLQALTQGQGVHAVSGAEVRHLLADLIERHPTVAALMLIIFERWPDRDPEVMLRFCLHGDTVQRAGLQLLDPSRPPRDMTKDELRDWQTMSLEQRLDEAFIADANISVADVRWFFSPMRLSRYGVALLLQPAAVVAPKANVQKQGMELVKQTFPQLCYEFGSTYELCMYLQLSPDELAHALDEDLTAKAMQYCQRMREEGVLQPS